MDDLKIDNRVHRDGGGLVARLGLDIDFATVHEPVRRLMGAGAPLIGVRDGDTVVPYDISQPTAAFARSLKGNGVTPPFELLLGEPPAEAAIAAACAPTAPRPEQSSSAVRCSAVLQEKLCGRGLKPRVNRESDGRWSFTATSRAMTGRPLPLRQALDHPTDKTKFIADDSIYKWGFTLAFSTWRRGAPAYDNLWIHPSGVSVHLACRPTEEHTKKSNKRVYSLEVDGLWAGDESPPPLVPPFDATTLRDAVEDYVAAWIRFGPTR